MQDRVKSQVEKGGQDVPARQVPRKAAALQEFKKASAHLREKSFKGRPFTKNLPPSVPGRPIWHMH